MLTAFFSAVADAVLPTAYAEEEPKDVNEVASDAQNDAQSKADDDDEEAESPAGDDEEEEDEEEPEDVSVCTELLPG